MRRTILMALVCVCAAAADASAQQVQRPARPYRGLFGGGPPADPNRTRSELTFTGSLLVGHDSSVSPGGSGGAIDPTLERRSGGTLTGEGALKYFHGRDRRSVSIDGRAVTLGYTGIGVDPTLGGYASLSGETNLGRVMQLRLYQSFAYEPTLVLDSTTSTGGLSPIAGVDAPVAAPVGVTSGYLEQRSWSSNSSVSLDRRWTPRHTTQVVAGYLRSTFLDELGYDTRSVSTHASHSWQFARTSTFRTLYSHNDSTSDASASGLTTPMTHQRIDASFGYARRLSPTRHLSLSMGGGGTYVTTLNPATRADLNYWMPSGAGSLSVDLGRTWSVAANYLRGVSVLQSVSLTSFATDSANVAVNGLVSSRIETSLTATYSNGQAGGANTRGRFENYTGSLQVRYALSRCCATAVNYDYYVYKFRDVADLSTDFLSNFDRQAIRVGFTLWLPLYGRYADGPARGRGN